jgi:hypothetical protein
MGGGSISINGVEMSSVICGLKVRSAPGEMVVVSLEIITGDLELVGEDVRAVAVAVLPPPPVELSHQWNDAHAPTMCLVCRQTWRVAARWCPGPLIRS